MLLAAIKKSAIVAATNSDVSIELALRAIAWAVDVISTNKTATRLDA